RIQLNTLEGQLLSRRTAGERDAFVLFTPFARRRDQQHVLSPAASHNDRKLASTSSRRVPLFDQSYAAHHAHQASEQRRRRNEIPIGHFAVIGRTSGRGPVSASTKHEKGFRAAQIISRTLAL